MHLALMIFLIYVHFLCPRVVRRPDVQAWVHRRDKTRSVSTAEPSITTPRQKVSIFVAILGGTFLVVAGVLIANFGFIGASSGREAHAIHVTGIVISVVGLLAILIIGVKAFNTRGK